MKCSVGRAGHAESAHHHRAQKRRVDLVDLDGEFLLPRFPPNPKAKAMGNSKWREPNREEAHEKNEQAGQ